MVNDGSTPAKVNIEGTDVEGTWSIADASDPTKDLTQAVLDAGSHTTDLTATFHPSDTADFPDNYNAATVDVEVAKAKIAIVADSYEKTYGNANPTLTDTIYADLGPATGIDPNTGNDYSTETDPNTGKPYEVYTELGPNDLASVAYTSALGSAPAATTDADLLAHAGSHVINPTQISDGDAGTASHEFLNNFDVNYYGGTLTVDQATGTTLGSFGPIYLTYGQTLNQVVNGGITPAEVNINGNDVAGTWTIAAASNPTEDLTQAVLDAGSHTTDLTATFHPFDIADWGDNYTAASVDVEVAKAKIAIVADSYERTYGDANPTLTDTIYADLGPYTDPVTNQTAEAYEKLGPADLASVSYTNALGGAAAASTDADLLAHAGSHVINPTQISDGGAGTASHEFLNNFDVSYANGSLTVDPATLTVAADANQSKIYGTDNPTLTGTVVSGLVNGDTQDSVGRPSLPRPTRAVTSAPMPSTRRWSTRIMPSPSLPTPVLWR